MVIDKQMGKEFIFINNVIFNTMDVSTVAYESSQEKIILRTYSTNFTWYVPLTEGPFILTKMEKALNEGENINFHYSKEKRGLWNLLEIFKFFF